MMKKISKRLLIIIILSVIGRSFCYAQMLHAVIFCNTTDESIGESMKVELMNVTKEIKKYVELIGYDESIVQLEGPDCTRSNLQRAIDELDVEEDDVVLTFYGGHGSHAPNNEEDPWPQYCMNSGFENQSNWVPMKTVQKWVQAKNPRLAIILSNCCNVVQGATTVKPLWAMGGNYTSLASMKADNFKRLFGAKGIVMATSSKIPEPSWCNLKEGGLFTSDLIDVLGMVGTGSVTPDWESVLKTTYEKCSLRDIVDRNGVHHKQHPFYEVNTGGSKIIDKGRGGKSNDALQRALDDLVDKETNQTTRINTIPSIISKFFSSNDKIMTLGTDMKTVVEYETPEKFLKRICLSPYIDRVVILRNKDNVLTVHEIRN